MGQGKSNTWIYKRWFGRRRGTLSSEWTEYKVWLGGFKIRLAARSVRGYIVVGWRRPDGTEVVSWSIGGLMRGRRMKKKKAVGAVPTQKHLAPIETEVLKEFLPIVEHMAMTQYEDGDPRKVGRITLTTFGSVWQAEVKDPDTLQQMRVSAPSFDDLIVQLSILLGSEDAPWEPDTWAQQQAKKSKK